MVAHHYGLSSILGPFQRWLPFSSFSRNGWPMYEGRPLLGAARDYLEEPFGTERN